MDKRADRLTIKRYSAAFKRKVVSEVESGKLRIGEAKKLYDITGAETIQTWIKKLGKHHLLHTIVRIEMKNEPQKIREQEKKIRALQAALSDAHLKIVILESTIQVVEEETGIELKKKSATSSLKKR
jgi:transposase-like protein